MLGHKSELLRVPSDLEAAEQQGVQVAILIRSLVLGCVLVLQAVVASYSGNAAGLLVSGAFLALGGLHWALIALRAERRWHRQAFLLTDFAGLAAVAVFTPLAASADVPQILALRSYGAEILALLIALSALSLTPGTVLWAGACAIGTLWAVFGILVAGVENPLSWGDLPANPTNEEYISLVLSPNFVGRGNRITESIVLAGITLLLAAAVARARALVHARIEAEARRDRMRSIFGQYVPEGVAEDILGLDGVLKPAERTASVLFTDIAGFTRLSEKLAPEELVPMLNDYFDMVARTVASHRGTIISFNGDAVLAAFNVPLPRPTFAGDAVACAREIAAGTDRMIFAGERLNIRIGIATGPVAAGSVGGSARQTYTVYGDTVNLAQRLEVHNKILGSRILACDTTRALLGLESGLRDAGEVRVAGREQPVRIHVVA